MALRARRKRHPHGSGQLALIGSDERAVALRRERDRIVKQIAAKKTELDRVLLALDSTIDEIRASCGALMDQQYELEDEVHGLFAELLEPGRLPKRKRKQVREIYEALQDGGLIGPAPPETRSEDFGERAQDFDGFDDGCGAERGPAGIHDTGGYSANKPSTDGNHSLRALFKRLVVALHPDRVQHETHKTVRTEAMKEVTRAYEAGDLARLIALEKFWATEHTGKPAPEDSSEVVALLERTIRELKVQLADVQYELKRARRSEPFAVMQDLKHMRNAGIDPVSALKAEAQARVDDLSAVRDFVAEFKAGKMSWQSFLEGPELPSELDDEEAEAGVHELMDMLLEELEQLERGKRRRKRRNRGASAIPF